MAWFNIIAGICSIFSLLITLFIANKVVKITNKIDIDKSNKVGKQTTLGKDNNVAGRDINDR
ncbi:hypothetical protein SAMN04488598_10724 [Halanaerobium congolense]|jgi:hypothetical protein|uniref:Uncharacterized protein n=1 Tax=Halanaerobium congolense TaxID=54121 RepID=A0A1H9ZS20_9FIRM|nr:hypothetical protein [Halanaerobium congolense]PTX16351.1 hypothetical protein C7953_1065 [Halanaerobium congolense]SDF15721.1 hypothetical protein SAMN04488598_10724 [Halanaerobium congolense]SES84153.1 hypothetical protein SAMN04515652_10824 [Halanaerobium congolense]SFP44995.1 hypothetical protein SAMN04488596_12024 [Halanaerobium congolense]